MTHMASLSASSTGRWTPDVIYTFADGRNQAQALARRCRAQFGSLGVHRFPDGETLITAAPNAPLTGRVVAIYRSLHDPNTKLVELLLAANALRALGAVKLVLIAPYLPYMRQDRAFEPGQSISQEAIGEILAGEFDAFVSVQPHLHRTHSLSHVFGGLPAIAVSAGPAIAAALRSDPPAVVVGPDEESEGLVREIAETLGVSWIVARKHRQGDREVAIEVPETPAIKGRRVVIVDDIVSSGGTVVTLAQALKQAGAGEIEVYVVHALFDQHAALAMKQAGIAKVISVSTIPHATNAIDVDDLMCAALGVA